jgi:hypothetical protein
MIVSFNLQKKGPQKRSLRLISVSLYLCLGLHRYIFLSFEKFLSLCNFVASARCRLAESCWRTDMQKPTPAGKSSRCTPDYPQHVGAPDPTFGPPAASREVLYKTKLRREERLVLVNNPMGKLTKPATRR